MPSEKTFVVYFFKWLKILSNGVSPRGLLTVAASCSFTVYIIA